MAEKGKKKGGGGAKKAEAQKASEKTSDKKPAPKAEAEKAEAHKSEQEAEQEAERKEEAEHAEAAGHAHAAGAEAHGHKPDIREYFVIFGVLAALTVLEVGVAKMPAIGRGAMILALMLLAVSKAAIVALFYMHLKHETKVLKLTVALPVAAPAVYALVLMSEAAWRFRF
jgi:cytochrome c oxidase subunit 4